MVVNSRSVNSNLPRSILAFFVPKGGDPSTNLGYGNVIDTVQAHTSYVTEYHLDASQVPLVSFDPRNWEEPFTVFN